MTPLAEDSRSKIFTVVVTHQAEDWIRDLLRSVQASSLTSDIVVVDDASSDRTRAIVREEFPSVELIGLGKNSGLGVGNNIGISHALSQGADYIFLLSQDALLPEDAIMQLAAFLENNTAYGVVSPLPCSPDLGHVDRATLKNYLGRHAETYLSDACLGSVKEHYPIPGVNAGAWFMRSTTITRVGGFDPLFFMYGEDDDLISRLQFHGIRFALLPRVKVVHFRQSVKTPKPTRWQSLQRRAMRVRSSLLVRLKQPGMSLYYTIAYIIHRGFLTPLETFALQREGDALLADLLAVCKLLPDLPRIRRHKALCEREGPHFLAIASPTERLVRHQVREWQAGSLSGAQGVTDHE